MLPVIAVVGGDGGGFGGGGRGGVSARDAGERSNRKAPKFDNEQRTLKLARTPHPFIGLAGTATGILVSFEMIGAGETWWHASLAAFAKG